MTIGLSARFNWNTYNSLKPSMVFNLLDFRPEFRYYWRSVYGERTKPERDADGNVIRRPVGQWLRESVFTNKRENPKSWRANYIGAYVNAGTYALKLSEYGRQGYLCGLGFTMGYGLPMYEYNRGAVDVELGFSLGLMLATSDVFTLDVDRNRYVSVPEMSRGLHVVPFPVVSELNVSFVWRKTSIRNKYVKVDHDKLRERQDLRDSLELVRSEEKLMREEQKKQKEAARLERKSTRDRQAGEQAADARVSRKKKEVTDGTE